MQMRRFAAAGLAAAVAMSVLSACAEDPEPTSIGDPESPAPSTTAVVHTSQASFSASIPRGAKDVRVNRTFRLDVEAGTLESVKVTSKDGKLKGRLSPDRTSWQSTARLQPGLRYKIVGVAADKDGLQATYKARFHTEDLGLDRQTFPSFFPTDGATVGVGMPVIIRFDVAVTDKASIEKHLSVTAEPAQQGAFHWVSDHEVRWRPKKYWQPGTKVTVVADIDSVPAGGGIFGQKTRTNTFTIGRKLVSKVDMDTHQMRVFKAGKLIRTIPITTGEEPKYTTRSGTKVIVEKFRYKDMNSETIGIDPESAEGYDLHNVEYAMRVTYSGEFVHAAPWSVGSQGHANVSHGCTGMSTKNAGWFYNQSMVGDPIEFSGTDRQMTLSNGFGDWNLNFKQYAAGSAL